MDKDTIATLNLVSALITELQNSGHLDASRVIEKVQLSAASHRQSGDPNNLADSLHQVSEYLLKTVPIRKG